MTDPYRYFRIEARELFEELGAGVLALSRGAATAQLVGALLRQTHTLKGAARVVTQPAIADSAHALEELLEPFRADSSTVPAARIDQMLALLDAIGAQLASLAAPVGTPVGGPPPSQAAAVPPPRVHRERARRAAEPERSTPIAANERTTRVSLAELEAMVRAVGQAQTQVAVLQESVQAMAQLRAQLAAPPGPGRAGRLKKIADLEQAAEVVGRAVAGCTDQIGRELRQVHDIAQRFRLLPVQAIVTDLERAARDAATAQGKQVHLEVRGSELRLDATVLTMAQAALRQLVRNAVVHGIEAPAERLAAGKPAAGRIRLEIGQNAGQAVFSCSDDGRGIDLDGVRAQLVQAGRSSVAGAEHLPEAEVLRELMLGGLSTAGVLSELAGRGIGLDIVRDCASRLGGQVSIRTAAGSGTTIELSCPLSLTAQQAILLDSGELTAIPLSAVQESLRIESAAVSRGPSGETLCHRGRSVPFLPLAAALGEVGCSSRSQPGWSVLLVRGRAGEAAIGVRRLVGTAEIAIRALPELTPVSALAAGVWVGVDGRPRLVLDPDALIEAASAERDLSTVERCAGAPILVVDDSLTTRMLEQSILESAGYEVEVAASAEEGLALAASRPYALALVDVEMPGMDGFGFVEQTRARPELRHLPCVLVTSRASAADRRRGLEAGARAHIDKAEFSQGTLLARIRELLAG